jgi:hypothetical protein
MSPALDPRPASRYQAVTLSEYRHRLDARGTVAEAPVPTAPRARVLRHVAVQLVRLTI